MIKKLVLVLICVTLLTGCWDERSFKEVKLVLAVAYDLRDDGRIKGTVFIPTVTRQAEGPSQQLVEILTAVGENSRDVRHKIDEKLSNIYDPAKMQVILIGEELAKKDIYSILDSYYRDPRSNLNALVAIVEEEAAEVVKVNTEQETSISKHIVGLLQAMEHATHTTGENLQLICAEMFEPGQDFVLPHLSMDEKSGVIEFRGLGLIQERSYKDEIPLEHATLLLLMMDYLGDTAQITKKVSDKEEFRIMNYITTEVKGKKRKLNINTSGGEVKVDLTLDLRMNIVEYPHDKLEKKEEVKKLEKKLSELLTKDAEGIIAKLKEAESDVFGIGRRLEAYHYKTWKKIDWKKEYPNIEITPKVKVTIENHGIIN
ncbi:germination protein, Ger(x)C family [Thalassobacillus cyri]|uniref:Germination protein, Ger(X)C family n=1 Tax=Thalassobacillus cyri TaxID=571932 RepID=A0A1H4GZQ6_9BACI|nr:Ger(x)C family spore germination protein [Thalassobacillus cyri]SEB15077.1 germination protein, Ger(x)C family [Thalassobacillus cyri]